jgi:exopolyphosphatase/guanosine-5'-triphosphate,3'-diphosphate pyrophosphatase
LEIVDGGQEAEIILATHVEKELDAEASYLYIDVGGGSTEISVFSNGELKASRSFPLGTVRLLQQPDQEATWNELKTWLKTAALPHGPLTAIGSGGNINKLFRLADRKADKPVSLKKLREIDRLLNSYSLDERIRILHLRPDRADVIIPATRIFISTMAWAKIKHIHIPQFGLADGLVRQMHKKTMAAEATP